MWTLLKSELFQWRKIRNRNELTSWINDWNVVTIESIKREKLDSEENPEIELLSSKIRELVGEIISEVTNEWKKSNWLFKYFPDDWLKNIAASADTLSDKMFITGLLINEKLSNTKNKNYIPFSDEEKLSHIRNHFISEYKDKIENILNSNSNSFNNAFIINFFK